MKQLKALLNGLTESLERGVDDPGKFVAETLAQRSLRDIAHVTLIMFNNFVSFK